MASATFTGNVFDETLTNRNCFFQAYHVQQNAWSNVRLSEYNQYSIDLADSDWLTNSNGASNNGENVLICFWIDDENEPTNPLTSSRSGLKPRLSILRVDLNGSNVYNINTQIIPKTAPTCTWSIPATATINNIVNSTHNSTDVYNWQFNGTTFYHDDVYFGEPMFDSIGISLHEYDWENGFITNDFYTYPAIGDYSPIHRTTNQYSLSSECVEQIRLKYNQPYATFSYSNNTPIYNDIVTITHNVVDPDSRITNIIYKINGVEITQNTLLNHSYDHLLNELSDYNVSIDIYWNDGWEDQMVTYSDVLSLSNVNPTIDLGINIDVNTRTFVSNAFDFEDRMDFVEFNIYVAPEYIFEETPTAVTWSLLSTNVVDEADYNASVTFYKGGQFKVTAIAYDQDGGSSELDEVEFSVQIDSDGTGSNVNCTAVYGGNQFFDWE
jgi:hypothetical protein